MDFIGLLNPISRGHRWILVAAEASTKWTSAKPVAQGAAIAFAQVSHELIATMFGPPVEIVGDCHRQFMSNLMAEYSKSVGSKKEIHL
jgi:hypothetical protein